MKQCGLFLQQYLPCLNLQEHISSVHLCIAGMCLHHTSTESLSREKVLHTL